MRSEVRPGGDIQAAIDRVSAKGGAVLLRRGEHKLDGFVRIAASGIVLRGEPGALLTGTGTTQRALVEVRGRGPGRIASEPVRIVDEAVPAGARTFRLAVNSPFRTGDLVLVRRFGNRAWIHEIAMDRIAERPGVPGSTKQWQPFALEFERRVVAVDGPNITIDAPVLCAIEERWGGGEVVAFDDRERIRNCGVEQLEARAEFDRSVRAQYGREKEPYLADERHAWSFVAIDNAVDAWARGLNARHFGYACVEVRRARAVTIEDCNCTEMVSVLTGSRRYAYSIGGQLCLVQRCKADTARHSFVVGARVCGPNVFLDCGAGKQYATSEPHHRWSVGGLYDNVKANIAFQDRQWMGTGHGWSGANYVAWNCEGDLVCQQPPTAQNWAIGHVGRKLPGSFPGRPDGHWESQGRHVEPRSLYLAQLESRRGLQ